MKALQLSGENSALILEEAIGILKTGGVVVVPTDTVYGLAADAKNEKAVGKIFEIKGRFSDKALPVFVSTFSMLNEITHIEDERILNFLKKAWPGKITCVLLASPKLVSEGGPAKKDGTIGVRMPNYELVLKIIDKFGGPLTGTSANVAGGKEHTQIKELIKEFNGIKVKPDLILDAGDLPPSKPSTVLGCNIWPPKILREGAVNKEELNRLIY